jgi:hypothetical protein
MRPRVDKWVAMPAPKMSWQTTIELDPPIDNSDTAKTARDAFGESEKALAGPRSDPRKLKIKDEVGC